MLGGGGGFEVDGSGEEDVVFEVDVVVEVLFEFAEALVEGAVGGAGPGGGGELVA